MLVTSALIAGGSLLFGVTVRTVRNKKISTAPRTNNQGISRSAVTKARKQKLADILSTDLGNSTQQSMFTDELQELVYPFAQKGKPSGNSAKIAKPQADDKPDAEMQYLEQRAQHYFVVSLASLGFAVGALAIPPLAILSLSGLIYTSAHFFRGAYQCIVEERKLKMVVVDAVLVTGIVATGSLIAGTLMCSLIWLAEQLLLKTEDRSRKNLVNIFGEQPRSVWVLKDGIEVEIPFEQLRAGDMIVVNAGEMIPADGVILSGTASIDQHTLTGESQPAEKTIGDAAFATTLVLSGRVQIQVQKTGAESVASQIGEVLLQTADFKETTQARWVERVDNMAPVTLGVGMLALPILGPVSAISLLYSFHYGYSMRVIAPSTMLNFISLASKNGILIKDGRSLELLNQVDTVVFDKTGTLTLEQPVVGNIHTFNCHCENAQDPAYISEETLLLYAAAAEYRQSHPIARAIIQAATERDLTLPAIDSAHYEVGYGIQVCFADKTIRVGSMRFMEMEEIAIPQALDSIQQHCHENGRSLVMVAVDNRLAGAIELHAVIRPEAKAIADALRQRAMSMVIISGDQEAPTRQLAQSLGIEHYFAETLPENKAELVAQLQAEGKSVCFIGDGINDSIALKKANVSISMSGATTIATDTAQIVLMDGSLNQLVELFDVAQNYHHNLNRSFLFTLLPTATAVGGILFLHFGLTAAVLLYYTGLAAGMGNTTLPLLKQKWTNIIQERKIP